MNIITREVRKSDYPHLQQLTGIPLPEWMDLDRAGFLAVAILYGQIVGVVAVGINQESGELVLKHMEVMRYYRRMRIARHLWTFCIGELIPTFWTAYVDEKFADVCCMLRSFGFRCVGRASDNSLMFVRN